MKSGFDIPIEERHESEVLGAWGVISNSKFQAPSPRPANVLTCAWRIRAAARAIPGFDVTPADLITGIITPVGIFKPRELWAKRKQLGWQSTA